MINIYRNTKYTILFLAIFGLFFTKSVLAQTASFIDIGFRVNQGTLTSPDIQRIAIENPSSPVSSPLKLAKNGIKYNVALVDPSHPLATKVHIKLADGIIKALRRFAMIVIDFPDQSAGVDGHESSLGSYFYATFNINNNSPYKVDFDRIDFKPVHEETAPNSFSIDPGKILSQGGFGNISRSMMVLLGSPYISKEGSATYSVKVDGVEVDTVTYTWAYNF